MTSRRSAFVLAVALSPLFRNVNAQSSIGWQDSYRQDYSYDPESANGPANWVGVSGIGDLERYGNQLRDVERGGNLCDGRNNNRPSPVNLFQRTLECPDIHEPLPRQINLDSDCGRNDVEFAITPGSLKAYYPLDDSSCERPTLILPGRRDPYTLVQMELHARSEHALDGHRFDAELQLVHLGTNREEGQVSTISVLFQATGLQDDIETEWLLRQWEAVATREEDACQNFRKLRRSKGVNSRTLQDYRKANEGTRNMPISNSTSSAKNVETNRQRDLQFTPSPCTTDKFGKGCEPLGPRKRMFPYNLFPSIWYFLYDGSLTSPPCSDVVEWRVIDEPRRISVRQYKRMTTLLTRSRNDQCEPDSITSPKGENARPFQRTQQPIYHCFIRHFGHYAYPPNEQ